MKAAYDDATEWYGYALCLQNETSAQRAGLESNIIEYIKENAFDGALDFTSLSDKFGLSARTLRQIIRNRTSISLREMLNVIRIHKAQELLINSRMSIAEISLEVGYLSVSYFIKNFRNQTGMTPSRYREK